MAYQAPMSRNEAILQNILGANNVLVDPQSRIEAILQAILYDETYDKEAMSRMEELLLAIKNNGTWNHEPISRNEEILYAKLNGETYDKEPQSRIEALLIDWCNQSPVTVVTDTAPYLFRQSGGDNNAYVGTEETDKLVGASAVVNQMLIPITLRTRTKGGIDATRENYTITMRGTVTEIPSDKNFYELVGTISVTAGHKYFVNFGNIDVYISNASVLTKTSIVQAQTTGNLLCYPRFSTSWSIGDVINLQSHIYLVDLTAMFGTTIADYIYSLEQATAGSGIAYLRKYGFFTNDYYPYTANTLQSVNTSKHVMRDGSNVIIGT